MKHLPSQFCTQAIAGASLFCLVIQPATASVLHNGWQYSIDVSYDSIGSVNGQVTTGAATIYEMYGMAIFDDVANNRVWVGFNGNFPWEGRITGPFLNTSTGSFPIENGSVAWGDLFFDFQADENSTFRDAHNASSLYSLKFSPNNDSGFDIGLYGNARGRNVARTNAGYRNLEHNNTRLNELNSSLPSWGAWMGDLPWNDNYFDGYTQASTWEETSSLIPNVISSGNFLGNATIHTQADLIAQGFDPGQFFRQGPEIFGVSFEKPAGFSGEFIATILSECVNDGMSLIGKIDPAPPPPPLPPLPVEECPIELDQLKSLVPDVIDGEWKRFFDVASHKWYDPEAYMGYRIEGGNGTTFTQLEEFPCGISANNAFSIFTNGKKVGDFQKGDKVDFVSIFSEGVTNFDIVFKELLEDPAQYAILLSLAEKTGNIYMRRLTDEELKAYVPEPGMAISLVIAGVSGIFLRKSKPKN